MENAGWVSIDPISLADFVVFANLSSGLICNRAREGILQLNIKTCREEYSKVE